MKNIEKKFNDNNIKITEQRKNIWRVIFDSEDHPDAEEIYRRVQTIYQSIGLATVYRTIAFLEEVGILERTHFEQNKKARWVFKNKE